MKSAIDSFLMRLSAVKLANCFNPYSDTCSTYDVEGAPNIRFNNLKNILFQLLTFDYVDVWIGRDLGYKGGRRTGLALTDECSLDLYAAHLGIDSLKRATKGVEVKERTAANVFQVMSRINAHVLTWNAFPYHPHLPGNAFTNRAHSAAEAKLGMSFLEELVKLFPVRRLVAIGNDAETSASRLGPDCIKVRHPSYGGQTEFLVQMQNIYGCSRKDPSQLTLL